MRFGPRRPSLTKKLAARASLKRAIRHSLGVKAPRGLGWLTNPRKAAYNRIYNRTTFKLGAPRRRGARVGASGCLVLLLVPIAALTIALSAAAAAAKHATAAPAPVPFDPTVERLPSGYQGQDFAAVFKKMLAVGRRGEFESSDDFNLRVEKAAVGYAYVAFAYTPEAIYDADQQALKIALSNRQDHLSEVLDIRITSLLAGHYVGVNAMGVKVQVEKRGVVQQEVAFEAPSRTGWDRMIRMSIPMEAGKAAALKPALRYLVVAKLAPRHDIGMAESSVEHRSPELHDPFDLTIIHEYLFAGSLALWVYNLHTGEVIRRFNIAGEEMPQAESPKAPDH